MRSTLPAEARTKRIGKKTGRTVINGMPLIFFAFHIIIPLRYPVFSNMGGREANDA